VSVRTSVTLGVAPVTS